MDKQTGFVWWKHGVVYQVYPRSYQDTNADGIGDLQGIIQRLDYLSNTLGVDAVWLSPFYPSPMADFGYDVSDYTNIDPMFGDLETFERLLEEVHRRKMHLIIDFVPNHTSDQHAWFRESRSSRDNPKRDWYFWRDAKPDGSLPNNWLSMFGGPAWEWDEQRGQYYLHLFLKEQPDVNWRNPELKKAMFDAIRFWLDKGVDGFRLDVAHFIMKDPDLTDNPPNPDIDKPWFRKNNPYDYQLHINDIAHPDVHQVYRELRQILNTYDEKSPHYSVGEIHVFDWKKWVTYYGQHQDELHMPFNFGLLFCPWDLAKFRAVIDAIEAALPEGAWPNYVMGNHDEKRLGTRYGAENVRLAAMLLLTLRGTPTLYEGEELGMLNVPIPPEKEQDPYGIRVPGSGRDGCRTPMQWDDTPNAGFTAAAVEPWLPLADDYRKVNVKTELGEPHSVLNLYRKLLEVRRSILALNAGSYSPIEGTTPEQFCFLRQAEGQRVWVALNSANQPAVFTLPQLGKGTVLVSSGLTREGQTVDLSELTLAAKEGLVVLLNNA